MTRFSFTSETRAAAERVQECISFGFGMFYRMAGAGLNDSFYVRVGQIIRTKFAIDHPLHLLLARGQIL